MHHLAIMNPRLALIPKILSGLKTIESRWYKNRIAPWDRIKPGDTVFFKDAGKLVIAKATVRHVLQKKIDSITEGLDLARKYNNDLCFTESAFLETAWLKAKHYAILVFLENPQSVTPFAINKSGYGNACAWICVEKIESIAKSTD